MRRSSRVRVFNELEVKRAHRNQEKLPEYPAPARTDPKSVEPAAAPLPYFVLARLFSPVPNPFIRFCASRYDDDGTCTAFFGFVTRS